MADYSQGLVVGDKVRIDSIAWSENSQWVGSEGEVVRVDRLDFHQPIKVKFTFDGTEREEWVKTATKLNVTPATVLELKQAVYKKAMELKAENDWCDEADRFLKELGAYPNITIPEPKEGTVLGFYEVTGHYVYRRCSGTREGGPNWSCTGDDHDYTWAQVLGRHNLDSFRVIWTPTPGAELPPKLEKVETWA